MLDYLTSGRLEIGAGGNPWETVLAGLDPAQIPGRYASGFAVLENADALRRRRTLPITRRNGPGMRAGESRDDMTRRTEPPLSQARIWVSSL